jgi:hypothetical protein
LSAMAVRIWKEGNMGLDIAHALQADAAGRHADEFRRCTVQGNIIRLKKRRSRCHQIPARNRLI